MEDQLLLTAALQEAYKRMLEAKIWPNAPLSVQHDGKVALREIVQGLGIEPAEPEDSEYSTSSIRLGSLGGSSDDVGTVEFSTGLDASSTSPATLMPNVVEFHSESSTDSQITAYMIPSTPLPLPSEMQEDEGQYCLEEDFWDDFLQWPVQ